MYKIAIAGASTLLGKELKDALSDSTLAAASFVLLDEGQALGQLDQVGDEVTFVQPIGPDAFDHADFTFFCGIRGTDSQALAAGAAGRVRRCWTFPARSTRSRGCWCGRRGWDGSGER